MFLSHPAFQSLFLFVVLAFSRSLIAVMLVLMARVVVLY
jgi:hypothetical protein